MLNIFLAVTYRFWLKGSSDKRKQTIFSLGYSTMPVVLLFSEAIFVEINHVINLHIRIILNAMNDWN